MVTIEQTPDDLPGGAIVDSIALCEQVRRAAEALQAELTAALLDEYQAATTMRHAQLATVGETGIARRVAPSTAQRSLEMGLCLRRMPAILAGWRNGLINETTARTITLALPSLADDEIALIEAELEPHLPTLTPRRAAELVRALVIEIDPDAADAKAAAARADQYVLVVDENDATATLIAQGPAEDIHAVADDLHRRALRAKAIGDPRPRGQVMFQSLRDAVLAGPRDETGAPRTVEIGIVTSIETLFGASDRPAQLTGHGPVAPGVIDELIDGADRVFYRRLITDPMDGQLVAVDARRRLFSGSLARFIRARDQRCRGPYCDAPIAHIDHIAAHAAGGHTTAENGQGVCVLTHLIKHTPRWVVHSNGDGTVTWTSPTGQTCITRPPPAR